MATLWLLFLCLLQLARGHELTYALFTAGPSGGFVSSGAVPAIELAEELINEDSSILPDYTLTHTPVADTKCDRTTSLNEYFDAVSPLKPTILGLLGCGCSVASYPVAEIVQYNSISQIAYASSSSEFNSQTMFPNFFRTIPSDADFTPATVTLIQYFGWRRIAFITQNESLFTETGHILMKNLTNMNIEVSNKVVSSAELMGESLEGVDDLFSEQDDYRVFFLNTFSNNARKIICEAYLRGYTYPRYAWLTYGWYQNNWWTEEVNPEPIDCSDEQLEEFLHRSLALEKFPVHNDSNGVTDVGLTPNEFALEYQTRLSESNDTFTFLATVAYDALWTFALALNRTSEMVEGLTREEVLNMTQCEGSDQRTGMQWELVSLENFTYSNELMGCVIRWNLQRTDFVGVSGHVFFDDLGSRVHSEFEIYQYRWTGYSVSQIVIADIERDNESMSRFVYKDNQSNDTVYPSSEGGIPPDGTPVMVIVSFHLALVIIFYILALGGLILCTVCLIFNFTQRKRKVVRLNSPNLNYFIILGSYIMNVSIFFRVMPSPDHNVNVARCNLDVLLNTIGYTLCFGSILAKMGRIHYIFHNPTAAKKTLKDWHLAIVVLIIAGIGTTLAMLQVSVPILRPIPYHAPNEGLPSSPMNEYGLRIMELGTFCFSSSARPIASGWIILTMIYLALLQLAGIILALRTRKVKVKALKDARFIVAIIYISAIALLVIGLSTFVVGNLPNVVELLFSGSLIVATYVWLSLVFIPKMVSVYRDPEGEYAFDRPRVSTNNLDSSIVKTNTSVLRTEDTVSNSNSRVLQLESKVSQLERTLREYEMKSVQSFNTFNVASVDSGLGKPSDMPLVHSNRSRFYKVNFDDTPAAVNTDDQYIDV